MSEEKKYLYKYMSLFKSDGKESGLNKNTLDLLKKGVLHFSSPLDFNDPFDSLINLENKYFNFYKDKCSLESSVEVRLRNKLGHVTTRDLKGKTYKDLNNQTYSSVIKSISINQLRIFCASSEFDNILMWSHYSDSHKGICVGFQFAKNKDNCSLLEIDSKKYEFKEIIYSNSFENEIMNNNNLRNYLYVKREDWMYEKEYRIILDNQIVTAINKNIEIDILLIKQIVFGLMTPFNVISDTIKELLSSKNHDRVKSRELKLYQMQREFGEYKIRIKEFDFEKYL